jgi:hypothetical protein
MSPTNPYLRHYLERYRWEYEAGDLDSVPMALLLCIINEELPPDWLRDAYSKAVDRVRSYEVGSWDDVFGKPLAKGKQLDVARRKSKIAHGVWSRVRHRTAIDLDDDGKRDKIVKDLFEEVGKEFGIKGTVAAEIYYEHDREMSRWLPRGKRIYKMRMIREPGGGDE